MSGKTFYLSCMLNGDWKLEIPVVEQAAPENARLTGCPSSSPDDRQPVCFELPIVSYENQPLDL
jgi:hypothetical protein